MQGNQVKLLDILISTLVVYILISFLFQMFAEIPTEVKRLLVFFDLTACMFFLIDWGVRFFKADRKLIFTAKNSLDLFVSLPIHAIVTNLGFMKIFQLARIIILVRMMHENVLRSRVVLLQFIGTIGFVLLMLVCPILILLVEQDVGNIKTAEDAAWWSYCTLTTIGYGDLYPVTRCGRLLAVLLSISGIALFSTVSALIVNFVFSDRFGSFLACEDSDEKSS